MKEKDVRDTLTKIWKLIFEAYNLMEDMRSAGGFDNLRIEESNQDKRSLHKCPVCEGRGEVQAGFYGGFGALTSVSPETCRTCNGKGVIWR